MCRVVQITLQHMCAIYQYCRGIFYDLTKKIVLSRATATSSPKRKMLQYQTEYKALHLINALAKDTSTELVGAGYCMGSALIITSIYTMIRLHKMLGPTILSVVILMLIATSGIVILLVGKAIQMHDISKNVLEAFRNI